MSAKRTEARSAEGIPVNTYDVEQARYNMVEQQIRTWEVLDQHVLDLLFAVRREEFVPPQYRSIAFADLEIPLGNGTSMWTPKIEARVLQEMKLTRSDQVLGPEPGGRNELADVRHQQAVSPEPDGTQQHTG